MSERVQTTHFIGQVVHRFYEIDSTNNYAKEIIAKNEPQHGTVILADSQTHGRGQSSTTWTSAPGKNLLLSIILQPVEFPITHQFALNQAVSLAITNTISTLCNIQAQIKWPNDILIDGKKVCGILIENTLQQQFIKDCIVGIGMNVNQVIFPQHLTSATSLQLQTGITFSIPRVVNTLCREIEKKYVLIQQKKFNMLKEQYLSSLFGYKTIQAFRLKNKNVLGEIKGVTPQGNILIFIENKLYTFQHKEIEFNLDYNN